LLLYLDAFLHIEVCKGITPNILPQGGEHNQSYTAEESIPLGGSQSDGFYQQLQTSCSLKKNHRDGLNYSPKATPPQVNVDFFNQGLNFNASFWEHWPEQELVFEHIADLKPNVDSKDVLNQQKFDSDIESVSSAPTNFCWQKNYVDLNSSAVEPQDMSTIAILNDRGSQKTTNWLPY